MKIKLIQNKTGKELNPNDHVIHDGEVYQCTCDGQDEGWRIFGFPLDVTINIEQ